jgi:hypothetical protein
MINNTTLLIRLIDVAIESNAGGHQVLGLLASARDKLILLSAAQDVAKSKDATLELLQQILDENN